MPLALRLWVASLPLLCQAAIDQVEPGVFRVKDTCNVYAVVRNGKALLIDFGSGQILRDLEQIGVRQADWILHTHFHRDQCQGDKLARNRGVRIAVPESERRYFENAEQVWQDKKVFHLYDMRNEFFAPRENIPVDRGLAPGTVFNWEGLEVQVVSSPGHTEGSLSYLVRLNGKTLAFCGDLMASPGKIRTMHDLEWDYAGTRGIAAQMASLNMIRQYAPDLLLPSHGEPSGHVQNIIPPLVSNLSVLYDEYNWRTYTVRQPLTGVTRMTPHVWHLRTRQGGTAYVVVSDSGRAFMWDCEARDVEGIAEIQRQSGFRQMDFIALSHYHDDHIGGVNDIKRRYGAKFWAMTHMVDVLERPMAYNLPCLWHEPTKVDRVLRDGERVMWEGIPLQFIYLPGQTEYTEGLLLDIDGRRILFDGDNVAYPVPGRPLRGHYVCRNYQRLDGGHVSTARKLIGIKPDFVAPNHYEWVKATDEVLESYLHSSERVNGTLAKILDQPDAMFGVDNNWLTLYPYQVEANPGDTVQVQVKFRNWLDSRSSVRAEFRMPEGWSVQPAATEVTALERSETATSAVIHIPQTVRTNRRYVITLDATREGERLGEVTEMLVNILPMRAH